LILEAGIANSLPINPDGRAGGAGQSTEAPPIASPPINRKIKNTP